MCETKKNGFYETTMRITKCSEPEIILIRGILIDLMKDGMCYDVDFGEKLESDNTYTFALIFKSSSEFDEGYVEGSINAVVSVIENLRDIYSQCSI